MKSRLGPLIAILVLILAACSAGATRRPTTAPASAAPATAAPGSAAPASLTIYGAASLKAALAKVKTAYEAANAGTTLTISTDSSSALETQDRAGRAGRRLPVGRHDEPAEARRQGPRRWRARRSSRATC